MKLKASRYVVAAVVAAVALSPLASAQAADQYRSGSCSKTTGTKVKTTFKAGVGVYFASHSSTRWVIQKTIYQLAPANGRKESNVSHALFGGTKQAGLKATGKGLQDGQRHDLYKRTDGKDLNYYAAKGGSAYVINTVTFDSPAWGDPSCTNKVKLP